MPLKSYTAFFADGASNIPSINIPIPDEHGTAFLHINGESLSDDAHRLADGDTIQHAIDFDGNPADTYDDPVSLARDIIYRSFDNQAAGLVLSRDNGDFLLTVYYLAP